MKISRKIKFNLNQVMAIAQKNTKSTFRFKGALIMSYINPFISIIFPFIMMGIFFSYQNNFGPWTQQNFLIYLFVGYIILHVQGIMGYISSQFRSEKYWLTFQALMIAPFNRFNLFFGYIVAYLVTASFSIVIFLIICFILYPISFLPFLLFMIFMILIIIIFAGFGYMIGGFYISNENMAKVCNFIFSLLFAFSCITYPYQIFPSYIQNIINFNPIYYIIDIMRLLWIENDIVTTFYSHIIHIIILFSFVATIPVLGILIFNSTFKKKGIVGF